MHRAGALEPAPSLPSMNPRRHRRFSLTRHRRSLWAIPAFGLLLVAAVWTATALQLQANERGLVARVTQDTEGFASAFEQYTRHAIDDADRLALLVKYEYEQHGARDLSPLIRAGVVDGHSVVLVSIIDADGTLTASSQPLRPVHVGDRDYFREHKARDTGHLDISKPVVGRSSGRPIIQLSRRMNNPDGSFAGLVLLSVTPDFFTQFYSEGDLQARRAGTRRPRRHATGAPRVGDESTTADDGGGARLVARAAQSASGVFEETSLADGVSRFVADRKVAGYPFIVMAAEARTRRSINTRIAGSSTW